MPTIARHLARQMLNSNLLQDTDREFIKYVYQFKERTKAPRMNPGMSGFFQGVHSRGIRSRAYAYVCAVLPMNKDRDKVISLFTLHVSKPMFAGVEDRLFQECQILRFTVRRRLFVGSVFTFHKPFKFQQICNPSTER